MHYLFIYLFMYSAIDPTPAGVGWNIHFLRHTDNQKLIPWKINLGSNLVLE